MTVGAHDFGLGNTNAQFKVYIGNRPNIEQYQGLAELRELRAGDIANLGQQCGNGWRKVFNVYAKLVFALNQASFVSLHEAKSWQEFRDNRLLQSGSNTSLLFSTPRICEDASEYSTVIHLVMGKTYAKALPLASSLTWLDHEFAIHNQANLLVCPYFDYRQLSNIKIIRLVELIKPLLSRH